MAVCVCSVHQCEVVGGAEEKVDEAAAEEAAAAEDDDDEKNNPVEVTDDVSGAVTCAYTLAVADLVSIQLPPDE